MIRSFLTAIFLTILCQPAFAGDTARVLFIGNSLTGVNDLPEQTRLVADSKGDVLIKGYAVIGGATLMQQTQTPATMAMIAQGGWDVVVMQEQSELPAFPDNQVQSDMYPYIKILNDSIRHYNPCAKVMVYMTWGWQNGDQGNCGNYPPICTYLGMDSLIRLRYKNAADTINAKVCPAGGTTRRIRALYPGINLYAADGYHPSPENTYAAACSFYSCIFGKSPVGATYLFSLTPADAANIQSAAKAVAYDSLTYWNHWYVPTSAPAAGFSQSISGKTVQFSNASTNAISYAWSFGDGGVSAVASPSHTYASNGTYTARLISKSACGDVDTLKKTIVINATAVNGMTASNIAPVAFPNPVNGTLYLRDLGGAFTTLQLMDAAGKLVKECAIPKGAQAFEVNMAGLASGVYSAKLIGGNGVILLKVEKAD